MKLASQFTAFLKDTVNLNQTRIDLLEGNVEAIQNFIRQCDWKTAHPGLRRSGVVGPRHDHQAGGGGRIRSRWR